MQLDAQAPPLAELPSQKEQDKHCLTHVPYEPWCSSCVAFRARADRHMRDDSTHAGAVPTISFDFCYTKIVSMLGQGVFSNRVHSLYSNQAKKPI